MNGKWQKNYEYNQHEASVNSISWAPYQYGLILACCSTDCSISVIQYMGDVWKPIKISKAHEEVSHKYLFVKFFRVVMPFPGHQPSVQTRFWMHPNKLIQKE